MFWVKGVDLVDKLSNGNIRRLFPNKPILILISDIVSYVYVLFSIEDIFLDQALFRKFSNMQRLKYF